MVQPGFSRPMTVSHQRSRRSRRASHRRGGAERQRDVERLADLEAGERRRRDADDGEWPIERRSACCRSRSRGRRDVVCQNAWLTTAACAPHPRRSSSGPSSRPRHGAMPSTRKNSPLTHRPRAARASTPRPTTNPVSPHANIAGERALVAANQLPERIRGLRVDAIVAAEGLRTVGPDFGELLRIGNRQAAQPDGVDQLKDRGVRPDAQRERQDRHGREDRTAPQQAQSISRIANRVIEVADLRQVCSGRPLTVRWCYNPPRSEQAITLEVVPELFRNHSRIWSPVASPLS